jgi:DNA-directed RNA polymerase specialized sigma24 family protein
VIDPASLRYLAGLTGEETAAVLGISAKTVDRHWVYTRSWLRREIAGPLESNENREHH